MQREITEVDEEHGLEYFVDLDLTPCASNGLPMSYGPPMFTLYHMDHFSTDIADEYEFEAHDLDDPDATVR